MRALPNQVPRVETGPTRFGEDWCGIFIRGDNSSYYEQAIRQIISGESVSINMIILRQLADLLSLSRQTRISANSY